MKDHPQQPAEESAPFSSIDQETERARYLYENGDGIVWEEANKVLEEMIEAREAEIRKILEEGRELPPHLAPRPARVANPVDFGTVTYDELLHLLESGAFQRAAEAQQTQTAADPAPTNRTTTSSSGESPKPR